MGEGCGEAHRSSAGCACRSPTCGPAFSAALLQKYLDNYDLSIRVIYVLGTLGFSIGTAVMAMFADVYVAMIMISTMGVVSMSISYCPYALLGQYHDIKEVRARPEARRAGSWTCTVGGHRSWGSEACARAPSAALRRPVCGCGMCLFSWCVSRFSGTSHTATSSSRSELYFSLSNAEACHSFPCAVAMARTPSSVD